MASITVYVRVVICFIKKNVNANTLLGMSKQTKRTSEKCIGNKIAQYKCMKIGSYSNVVVKRHEIRSFKQIRNNLASKLLDLHNK